MLQPQNAAGPQLFVAGHTVLGPDGLRPDAILLRHRGHALAGLRYVVFRLAFVALLLHEVRLPRYDVVESKQVVELHELAHFQAGAAGQAFLGFAGQRHQGPQPIHAHVVSVLRINFGLVEELAGSGGFLLRRYGRLLNSVGDGHQQRVHAAGRNGRRQQPAVVAGRFGGVGLQRLRDTEQREAGRRRKFLQRKQRLRIMTYGGLVGQLVGQQSQHVGVGLLGNLHFRGVEIGGQRVGLHAARAQVIAQQSIQPVVQRVVVALEVLGRRLGRNHDVLALIHHVVHHHAKIGGGFAFKLPVAHGVVDALCIALHAAFLDDQEAEVQRQGFFLKHPLDEGKIGVGQVHAGLKRGRMAAQGVYFLLHHPAATFGEAQVQAGEIESGRNGYALSRRQQRQPAKQHEYNSFHDRQQAQLWLRDLCSPDSDAYKVGEKNVGNDTDSCVMLH